MSNKTQVEILKKDVLLFNSLRSGLVKGSYEIDGKMVELDENCFLKIDLQKENLRGYNFSGVDLHEANLKGTDLRGSILNNVIFNHADLRGCSLRGAIMNNADLRCANLYKADLNGANLTYADFSNAYCCEAYFHGATLSHANLNESDFYGAELNGASLAYVSAIESNLSRTILNKTDLSNANLNKSRLIFSTLVDTCLYGTDISECIIYGIAAWDVKTNDTTKQSNLYITMPGETSISIDNIEVAQFIHLIVNNKKLRSVINTITSKLVLILGRFTTERIEVLNAIKKELNEKYVAVIFDFNKPNSLNLTETITLLAHMSKFVVADFTDEKAVLLEADHIIRNIAIPFIPIFKKDTDIETQYIRDFHKGRTYVSETVYYDNNTQYVELAREIIHKAEHIYNQLIIQN